MIFTNKFSVPSHIIDILNLPVQPEEGIMRVTTLNDAPLIRRLMYERWDDLKADYSDFLVATFGSVFHFMAEEKQGPEVVAEQRLSVEIDGWTVTGKPDYYRPDIGALRDTKVSGVGYLKFHYQDLTNQLNVYAWLLEKHGKQVKTLGGDLWYRNWDWKIPEFQDMPDYPKIMYQPFSVPLWPMAQREQFVKDRLHYHTMAENDMCSAEERWLTPSKFAVTKPGASRSMRNLNTLEEAETWIKEKNKKDVEVVERKGGSLRCKYFCELGTSGVCPFYAENIK